MQVEHFIKFKKMLRNSVYEIKNIVIQWKLLVKC
jgi:hypothetical protein